MNRLAGVVFTAVVVAARTVPAGEINAELASRLQQAGPNERIPIIVTMKEQAIDGLVEPPEALPRGERRRMILEQLREVSETSQRTLGSQLAFSAQAGKADKIEHFWLANVVALEATPDTIEQLAGDPGIQSIDPDRVINVDVLDDADGDPETPPAVNGIRRIRAPDVWTLGYTGVGAVVGSIDTGVRGNHDDLDQNFRGGSNSWMDRVGSASFPDDNNGHGTHTTGSAVGRNRVATNYIGAAPGAHWIACRTFDSSGSSPASRILGCMQWMADPDSNPWTDDLPDVVNNSWAANDLSCSSFFRSMVAGWRALGIFPAFAAGNNPFVPGIPAAYTESFAVGAVDRQNVVANFSARGPSTCDGTIFPEVVAPGTKVRSAWLNNTRRVLKGTSMATPHVSGTVALLRGRNPNLSVPDIERILKQTGLDLGPAGADNSYGFGMVDAYRAMICVINGSYLCGGTCP